MNRVIRMVLRGWDDVSEIVMSACTGAMAAISPAVLGPSVPLSLLTRPGVGERGAGAEPACSTAASNCSSNCSAGARTSLQPLTAGGGGGARVASGRGQQTETRGPWLRSNCVRRETWLLKLQLKMSLFIDHCWWSLQSSQKNKKCFLVDIFYDRKSIVLTKSMKLLHCFLLHIKKIRWSAFFINMTFLRLYEKIVPIVMVLSWFILDCHKKNIAAGYFALSSIMSKKKLFHNN